jgi:hypothetical protein
MVEFNNAPHQSRIAVLPMITIYNIE